MGLPDGIICTEDEYQRSLQSLSITCLTRGDSIGLTIVGLSGFLSLLAVVYFICIILRNVFWRVGHVPSDRLRIFHQPMDILMFSLIMGDIIQAIGMALLVKWVYDGKVEIGGFCNVQGVFRVLGSTAVAFSSLAIALYTFIEVWLVREISSMGVTIAVVVAFWAFDAILVILGFTLNRSKGELSYMAPAPYWCSPNRHYLVWKTFGEYFWMWIALFASILLYIPLWLWMRGNIEPDNVVWWRFKFQKTSNDPNLRALRRRSLIMLAYPAVYCILVLPMSIVRWPSFVNDIYSVPAAGTFFVVSVFALSGFVDVILLLTTRPRSGLFGQLMFGYSSTSTVELKPPQDSESVALPPNLTGAERDVNDNISIDEVERGVPPQLPSR